MTESLLTVGCNAERAVATRLREDGKPDTTKFRVQFVDVHANRPDVVTTGAKRFRREAPPTPAY